MNNKRKLIEEMASDIDYACVELSKEQRIEVARALVVLNYRKIPENAVVLTGTETEEHFVDLLTEFDEMGFYPLTTCANAEEYTKEWKRRMLYAIGQLRKETEEKFAERLVGKAFVEFGDDDYDRLCWLVGETCKEMVDGK